MAKVVDRVLRNKQFGYNEYAVKFDDGEYGFQNISLDGKTIYASIGKGADLEHLFCTK